MIYPLVQQQSILGPRLPNRMQACTSTNSEKQNLVLITISKIHRNLSLSCNFICSWRSVSSPIQSSALCFPVYLIAFTRIQSLSYNAYTQEISFQMEILQMLLLLYVSLSVLDSKPILYTGNIRDKSMNRGNTFSSS